jgi:hypothetical protein
MLLQASGALPTVIRYAKPNDFKALGKLYTSALADNQSWKIIWGDVEPEVAEEWLWEPVAAHRTTSGIDAVRVLERLDTHVVIGVIWISEAKEEDKDEFWMPMPEGSNQEELQKMLVPSEKWHAGLLKKYSNYIGE